MAGLFRLWPTLLAYVLSFLYIGSYRNNHHHLMYTVRQVNGHVLWANLHLLFWLSLFPFVSDWAGESRFAAVPMTCYAGVALMAALAYTLLSAAIIQADPSNHLLADALGNDLKGKLSLAAYVLALVAPFNGQLGTVIFGLLMVAVALMWLIPDHRIERVLEQADQKPLG